MKRWIWLGFAVLGLAIAVVLALPSIAGSKWVYQPLVDRLAAEKFKLTIDEVSLGWFRPISFGKIELTSPTILVALPFSTPSLLEHSIS